MEYGGMYGGILPKDSVIYVCYRKMPTINGIDTHRKSGSHASVSSNDFQRYSPTA